MKQEQRMLAVQKVLFRKCCVSCQKIPLAIGVWW